jgi:hypothetical protein
MTVHSGHDGRVFVSAFAHPESVPVAEARAVEPRRGTRSPLRSLVRSCMVTD